MGRPGWPLIDRLVNAPRGDGSDDEGDDAPDLSDVRGELVRLCASGELRELTMDALLDGSSYSVELRHLAVQAGGAIAATPEELPALAVRLGTERDPEVLNGILAVLANSNGLDPRALLAAYQAQGSSDTRLAIARVLVDTPGTSADTLALLAQSPDDAVRRYATLTLLMKSPPVQGYLVSGIVDGSQAAAAGIKEGDIIVSYNGSDVRSTRQLAKLKSGVAADATVPIAVYRDGVVIPMTLKPGQIGINGQVVKPVGAPAAEPPSR